MTIIRNTLDLKFRKFLKTINFGYRIFNQKLDFRKMMVNNFPVKSSFAFIQVGANDGVSFDTLYEFVIERKSSGIVIEPIRDYYDKLVANYIKFPEIIKINKAVHNTEKNIRLYKIDVSQSHKYPEWVNGIASLDRNHHKKLNIATDDIVYEDVDSDTLMNIIKPIKNTKVDLFQIDTEGFDYEVLKMLDFKQISPKIVKFEYVNLKDRDRGAAFQLLKQNRYKLFLIGGDCIAVDIHRVKLYWK